MSVLLRASNGVGYNYEYTVTAADQSAGYVIFDFNSPMTVAASFMLLSSSDAVLTPVGALVTFPSAGKMKIANGGSVSLTAGQKLIVTGGIIATDVSDLI
jgi:hypothetical protein